MPLEADTLEASVDIAASPAQVWALVGDPRNMKRWSPQLVRSFLRGGTVRAGAKMFNFNRKGVLVWPTQSVIEQCEPEREIAWRMVENHTIWGLRLEPVEVNGQPGTRLSQYRAAPRGISDLSVKLINAGLGGVDNFTEVLKADMSTTLGRIKADVEA